MTFGNSAPRGPPVSSRLRNQKSPMDPRYMQLKRAAARPIRSASSKMRNSSKKTVNYSELTDDEDDETNSSSESELPAGCTDESDPSWPLVRHGTQQMHAQYIDLTMEGDEAPAPCAAQKLKPKTNFHRKLANAQAGKNLFQSTLSHFARVEKFHLQMSKKNSKSSLRQRSSAEVILDDNDSDSSHPAFCIAQVDSAAGTLFKNLATEILQQIASYLLSDADLFNYRNACRSTFTSITSSVWRQRFLQKYDMISGLDKDQIAQKYEHRRRAMIERPIFDFRIDGQFLDSRMKLHLLTNQNIFLIMLRDLLIESNNYSTIDSKGTIAIRGKNLQVIKEIISIPDSRSYVDIVDAIFCTPWDETIASFDNWTKIIDAKASSGLIYTIQLCLAPYYLGPLSKYRQRHFDISQFQVYNHDQPLFVGPEKQVINCRLLLHMVNFFQFHLKADGEGLLAHCYPNLRSDQVPHPWIGTIKAGVQPLGRHWKGIYTNLTEHTLHKLRSWNGAGNIFAVDHLQIAEAFQDISFFFDESRERPWPKKWEDVLCSDTFKEPKSSEVKSWRTKEVFRPDIKEFWGTSRRGDKNGKNGHFFGRIHSMPPQQGINGFQRVTMMKFDAVDVNGVDTYDGLNVWAYEGCVFPGGTVIAGRWWNPRKKWNDKQSFGGPFLWWNVESPTTSTPIFPEEALDFQDSFFSQVCGLH